MGARIATSVLVTVVHLVFVYVIFYISDEDYGRAGFALAASAGVELAVTKALQRRDGRRG